MVIVRAIIGAPQRGTADENQATAAPLLATANRALESTRDRRRDSCGANDVGQWLCCLVSGKVGNGTLEDQEKLFAGRHFHRKVIIPCVRWYLPFTLRLRDLAEMMDEGGLALAHTTIMCWVQHYTPEFEKRWQ